MAFIMLHVILCNINSDCRRNESDAKHYAMQSLNELRYTEFDSQKKENTNYLVWKISNVARGISQIDV